MTALGPDHATLNDDGDDVVQPRPSDAVRFLAALDPQAKSFTFQTFDDDPARKVDTLARIRHGSLIQLWPELLQLNNRGAGIFVTVNATDLKGRKKDNVVRVRALFADLDGAPLDPVTACSMPPHIVVESSPGRWHAYWLVNDVPLDQFGPMQKALTARFNGDPGVHDLPRVLRVPGFVHRKAQPFRSVLQHVDARSPYTLAQMLETFPPLAEPEPADASGHPQGNGADRQHGSDRPQSRWRELNERALASLSVWVPLAFPTARKTDIGYRVTSADLGRGREEDLSLTAKGIKYFGDHDMGDPRAGRRTPLDIIMEFEHLDFAAAAQWLERALDSEGSAEDIPDPLEGLVERAAADPGAPFIRETLEALAALKKSDRAAFEGLRAQLKGAARVTALDEAIAEENGDTGGRGPSQADILLDLAQAADLFHAPDGTGFADLDVNGHRETWPIRAKGFRRWLARAFYGATQGAPSSEALQSALNVIEAKAHFDAPERAIHVRVGGLDGRLYLDLGDEAWRAVEVDATGWRVVDNPPVRFRRAAGMQPLPVPVAGGSVETLRSFLNVKTNTDFVLVVAWALAALRDRGPYPVIVLSGEQGSAKSTFCAILRALLDPNTAPLRALPREDRDLFIAASNGYVLAFDNVSGLPGWISDTLCRLATGGGFAVRQLYTDQDEVLFDATRPVILNGIEEIVTRPDLADRAIFLTLEPIPEECRRPEQELWAAFEAECPRILGVLLDAVVIGLKQLPETRLERLPRMADFALWATACEAALWPAGTFWSAYCGNRDEAVEGVIDADPVATAVRALMEPRTVRTVRTQTAADLLGALAEVAGERIARSKTWPDGPRALAGRLRRAATFLRKIGIEIDFLREGRTRARMIVITATPTVPEAEQAGKFASAPSASVTPKDFNDLARTQMRTQTADADANGRDDTPTVRAAVRANPLKNKAADGADDADAKIPTQSGPETPGWRTRL